MEAIEDNLHVRRPIAQGLLEGRRQTSFQKRREYVTIVHYRVPRRNRGTSYGHGSR